MSRESVINLSKFGVGRKHGIHYRCKVKVSMA